MLSMMACKTWPITVEEEEEEEGREGVRLTVESGMVAGSEMTWIVFPS